MTWISTVPPTPERPDLLAAIQIAMAGYPAEYQTQNRSDRQLPPMVMNDSIVASHSLIPKALQHVFAGFAAMMDPALPLTRRQHEMIATCVSALNRCVY